jgi:hypothetical protein
LLLLLLLGCYSVSSAFLKLDEASVTTRSKGQDKRKRRERA